MSYLIHFLNPTNLTHTLTSYFEIIRIIETCRQNQPLTRSDQHMNQTVKRRLRVAHLIVTLACLRHLLLYVRPTQNAYEAALNADIAYMLGMNYGINLFGVFFLGTLHFYLGQQLFQRYHPVYLSHLSRVWQYRNERFVLLSPYLYGGKMVKRVKSITQLMVYFIMILYGVGELFILLLQCQGLFTIWQHSPTGLSSVLDITLILVYFEAFSLLSYFFGYYIVYILTLVVSILVMSLAMGFAMLRHVSNRCAALLATLPSSSGFNRKLNSALRYRKRNMILWIKLAAHFSDKLLILMLFTLPNNSYLFMLLLFNPMDSYWILLMVVIIVAEWLFIFIIHIVFVRFNTLLNQPNHPLLHVASRGGRGQNSRPFKTTLALALHIEAFHCNTSKSYGFGYGYVGVVSRLSFTKTLLMYGEFIIYAYQIIKS